MPGFVIELFLRGLVLCLLTSLALRLLHKSAAAHRHLVCVSALLLLPLMPWMPRLIPTLRLLPPQKAVPMGGPPHTSLPSKSELPDSPPGSQEAIPATKPSTPLPTNSATAAGVTLPPAPVLQPLHKVTAALVTLWGLGMALLLLRLLRALLALHRLEAAGQRMLLGNVPVLVSEQVTTPLTWGIRNSVILLPACLLSGDLAVCASALKHEQAHLARWDWAWNLLAELVCACCWFQPGAWWLRARLRLESERACDDRVLLSGIAATDYAAHLLEIVRTVCIHNEIAPAMASGGEMEPRMRHILDPSRSRQAQPKWLALSALSALGFLPLAALRVSARPASPQPPADRGTRTMNASKLPSQDGQTSDGAGRPATVDRTEGQGLISPVMKFENVVWGKAEVGLQPGFLLTTPGLSPNGHVRLNTRVDYMVLVRNVSNRERIFAFRSGGSNPWSNAPYFIPNDDLRDALRSSSLPDRFHALGVTEMSEIVPAYEMKLAPGEAVVVPQTWPFGAKGLYLGDADQQSYPRIETIKKGKNWIVQPITIHLLTGEELVEFEQRSSSDASKTVVTIVGHDGKIDKRSIPMVGAQNGGKQLYSRVQLEVGTPDAR